MQLLNLVYFLTHIASVLSGEDGFHRHQGISLGLRQLSSLPGNLESFIQNKRSSSDQEETGAKKDDVVRMDSDILDGNDIMTETTTTAGALTVNEEGDKLQENYPPGATAHMFDESVRSKRGEETETTTTEETTIFSHLPPPPTEAPPPAEQESKKDTLTDAMKRKGKAEAALVPILKLSKVTPDNISDENQRSVIVEVHRGANPKDYDVAQHRKAKTYDSQLRHAIPAQLENVLKYGNALVGTESAVVTVASEKDDSAAMEETNTQDLMSLAERQKRSDRSTDHDMPEKPQRKRSTIPVLHALEKSLIPHPVTWPVTNHKLTRAHTPPISNAHVSELSANGEAAQYQTAKAKKSYLEKPHEDDQSKKSRAAKTSLPDTKEELRSIFSSIQQSHHHKLTRSEIRELAKKAVMLATQKHVREHVDIKLKEEAATKDANSKRTPIKASKKSPTTPTNKKLVNEKHAPKMEKAKHKSDVQHDHHRLETGSTKPMLQKSSDIKIENVALAANNGERHDEEFSINTPQHATKKDSDVVQTEAKDTETSRSESAASTSEFSEDIKQNKKQPNGAMVTDDAMSTAIKRIPDLEDVKGKDVKATSSLEESPKQVSAVEAPKVVPETSAATVVAVADVKPNRSLDEIFDDPDSKKVSEKIQAQPALSRSITEINLAKKSDVPSLAAADKIRNLKSALSKAKPDKVPGTFLPDLPSGIRMIAWKELLKKKAKQLSDMEAQVDVLGIESTEVEKPVTINIDIDPEASREAAKENEDIRVLTDDVTYGNPEKKDTTSEEPTNSIFEGPSDHHKMSRHVKYLQNHISGARSLRKLIAKTLISHCKSTGKRILEAFIAMDKALERAQAIATIIGKKFHVNADRIEHLVGDKEDEVVETFLRDIFTNLGGRGNLE